MADGDGVRVYLVTETVMYEGKTIHGVYTQRDAAEEHLQALEKSEYVPYVTYRVEAWDAKDGYG